MCRICGAASSDELCPRHKEARERLAERYKVWKERKGSSWEEYLEAISRSELAGIWVREVAEYILETAKGKGGQSARTPDACPG